MLMNGKIYTTSLSSQCLGVGGAYTRWYPNFGGLASLGAKHSSNYASDLLCKLKRMFLHVSL